MTFVSLYMDCVLPFRPAQATLDSAAAGRSRAARQPPNPPAIRPPRTASPTARTIAVIVTGADRCTATVDAVCAALAKPPRNGLVPPVPVVPPVPPKPPAPPAPPKPPNRRAPPGVAVPVAVPREALSDPEKWSTR